MVTHQLRDAFYVATNMAVRGPDGKVSIVAATPEKERETEFIMLRDGVIVFEGDADRFAQIQRSVHRRRFCPEDDLCLAHVPTPGLN